MKKLTVSIIQTYHNIMFMIKLQHYGNDDNEGGQQIIGRMPVVSVQDSERYYLRMLLLRKTAAINFDDLKTVNGTVCNSFQQACRELGFLE